jgi:Arc/MetJ-type ribon-helix-helix transcriptional regulator
MSETEKITINMSVVDLGKIDLLVQEGLYSNRTDFFRTAIRNQIKSHDFELQQSVYRHSYGIGAFHFNRADPEKVKSEGTYHHCHRSTAPF